MPITKRIDLPIETDVLTPGYMAEVVNAIMEFLLYQRHQIPFVCQTFKYYVGKWQEEAAANAELAEKGLLPIGLSVRAFNIHHQRRSAIITKEAISTVQEVIRKCFERNAVSCMRFLFGGNILSIREVYTLHIPTAAINRNHSHQHHRLPHGQLGQTLLGLLTNASLQPIFSSNLYPTKIQLEIQMMQAMVNQSFYSPHDKIGIFPKVLVRLPSTCKEIHLHLQHRPPPYLETTTLKCCRELQIYEDMRNLSLNSEEASELQDSEMIVEDAVMMDECSGPEWWAADVSVHGFKDKLVNGTSIWSSFN